MITASPYLRVGASDGTQTRIIFVAGLGAAIALLMLVSVPRFELGQGVLQTPVLAITLHGVGRSGGIRTRISWLKRPRRFLVTTH